MAKEDEGQYGRSFLGKRISKKCLEIQHAQRERAGEQRSKRGAWRGVRDTVGFIQSLETQVRANSRRLSQLCLLALSYF